MALAVVALAPAQAAQAAFPGQNGRIAFERDLDPGTARTATNFEIYSMNPDGTDQTRLTIEPADDLSPTWSPDGTRIAFHSTRNDPDPIGCKARIVPFPCARDIYVMNADGTGVTHLTSGFNPAWAPDGQRLIFEDACAACSPQRHLGEWVINSDGSGRVPFQADLETPTWSPDGSKIAGITGTCHDPFCEDHTEDIWLANPDGSQLAMVPNTEWGYDPNWSPDGRKLAMDGVSTVNRDGTGKAHLRSGHQPAWSPDGTKITYENTIGCSGVIYVMNADGTAPTPLTTCPNDRNPDWQPLPTSSPPPPYDHPRVASRLVVSLVPLFAQTISPTQCQARGGAPSTHGPPRELASCNPPVFRPGTAARMGPGSEGAARLAVIHGDTSEVNGDQADLTVEASITDVRTVAGADYVPAPSGPDVTLVPRLRISDRHNRPSASDPATVVDFTFAVPIDCSATAGPEGATCAIYSSFDATIPGSIRENEGMVVQTFRLRVNDAGGNGNRGDPDDQTFAIQGLYVP